MQERVTTTTSGQVRGVCQPTGLAFLGIPFAAPPVGPRRFKPPVAPEPWAGVRDCSRPAPACPQPPGAPLAVVQKLVRLEEPQDEDCLYLNVWTPGLDDGRRPVMVWIHGGAFRTGSGATWPFRNGSFSRDGIVLVTINYRLHAFGHLYLEGLFDGADGSGNAGILDQVAALEWVQENITSFGGDPDKVTIFGESAGGSSVAIHLGLARDRPLFHRAISMSGAANMIVSAERARLTTEAFLAQLDVEPGDWVALRAVPPEQVVRAAAGSLVRPLPTERVPLNFRPVLDGHALPHMPSDAIAAGSATGIDVLVGCTADEWRLVHAGAPGMFPPPDLHALSAHSTATTAETIADLYRRVLPSAQPTDIAAAVDTDLLFKQFASQLAEAVLHHHDRVWMYRFCWPSPVQDGELGAFHGLDVPFVFDALDDEQLLGNSPPAELARQMHDAWVRFAASGNPQVDGLPGWPTYDLDRRSVMMFDTASHVDEDPEADRRRLWGELASEPIVGPSASMLGERA